MVPFIRTEEKQVRPAQLVQPGLSRDRAASRWRRAKRWPQLVEVGFRFRRQLPLPS